MVQNGQKVNAAVTNAAYISKTSDSDTTGKIGLKNTDTESGSVINNAQKAINKAFEASGVSSESDINANNYSSNNYINDGDNRKVAIEKLDTQLKTTTDALANKYDVTNPAGYQTSAQVDAKISALVASAPATLDTLNELATALGNDPNFATTVTNSIATKEPAITAGTTAQYYRGDKTFQTLDKTAVGLGSVTNDSQLKRSANDFNTFTEKTTPAANDILIIEDSAASGAKKYIKYSNLGISSGSGATAWQDLPSVAAGTWIKATTTNPTFGTIVKNKGMWRRNGGNLEIEWDFRQSSAGTAGSGTYLLDISGLSLTIDTAKKAGNTGVASQLDFDSKVGVYSGFNNDNGTRAEGGVYVYNSTQLKVAYIYAVNGTGTAGYNIWGSGGNQFSIANLTNNVRISVPISGW